MATGTIVLNGFVQALLQGGAWGPSDETFEFTVAEDCIPHLDRLALLRPRDMANATRTDVAHGLFSYPGNAVVVISDYKEHLVVGRINL